MQCLHSTRLPLSVQFGQIHGPGSDPRRFSINLRVADSSRIRSCRSPYLSPPMSGTPPPEKTSDVLYRERRGRHSSSPTDTSRNPLPNNSNRRTHETEGGVSEFQQSQSAAPSISPFVGVSPVDEIRSTHLHTAFGSSTAVTSRLLPRSTRRAKAHVASACVNCKKKHLGCDSARPCRRCVVAGKEESCVDVTHKRRGRPPLKAEEGPIRTYESPYGQSSILRVSQHPSNTLGGNRGHKRASSSREIRPNMEFDHARSLSGSVGDGMLQLSPTSLMKPPLSSPPMITSPSATMSSTSFPSVNLPPRRPSPSDQQLGPQRSLALDFPGQDAQYHRTAGNASLIRSHSGDSFQFPHLSHKPQSLSDSSYRSHYSSHSTSSSLLLAPTHSRPVTHPISEHGGHSQFRLPPIIPRTNSDTPRSRAASRPKSISILPRMEAEQRQSTSADYSAALSSPHRLSLPLTGDLSVTNLLKRNISHHDLPPPLSRPRDEPQKTQSQPAPTSARSEPSSCLAAELGAKEDEKDARPAKRLKMELTEMVND